MDYLLKTLRSQPRRSAITALIIAIAVFLLLYRLGSLTHGLGPSELSLPPNSWSAIWQNPLNLPLHLVRYAVAELVPSSSQFARRLPSAIFGLLTLAAFARILRLWYGQKATYYGLALFGVSSWFLHVSRVATFDILYLWATATLIALTLLIQFSGRKPLVFYTAPVVFSLLAYVPGMIWLVALNVLWHREYFVRAWRHFVLPRQRLGWAALWLASLAPLAIRLAMEPHLIKPWLGLPGHFASLATIFRNFAEVFEHIFVRGPGQPELWLGHLPALSFFAGLMFVVGVYFYARSWRAQRSRMLLAFTLLGALLVSLGGPVSLSIVVPLIYLVAVAGIGFLLRHWLKVFPRNPLARGVGVAVIAVAVGVACLYNLRLYFVAWPNNSATRQEFHNHR